MEPNQFDCVGFISSLSGDQKDKFCDGKLDFVFPNNQEITCKLFRVLLDVASDHASNRNNAVEKMILQINSKLKEKKLLSVG